MSNVQDVLRMVSYDQFDPNKLFCQSPTTKTWESKDTGTDGKAKKGSYSEMYFLYDYGNNGVRVIDEFCMEFPITESDGIAERDSKASFKNYSTRFFFDLTKPDVLAFLAVMNEKVYPRIVQLTFQHKGVLKLHQLQLENMRFNEAIIRPLVYYPRDDATGEIINGKNPSNFYDLYNGSRKKTLYTLPNGEIISWDLLKNANVTGKPLIHFSHLYIGTDGKTFMKAKVSSFIVTKVEPNNTANKQIRTAEVIQSQNPGLVDTLKQQIASLSLGPKMITSATFNPSGNDNSNNSHSNYQSQDSNSYSVPSTPGPVSFDVPRFPVQSSYQDFSNSNPNNTPSSPQTPVNVPISNQPMSNVQFSNMQNGQPMSLKINPPINSQATMTVIQ
jgi:hypothetical protein